MHIFFSGIGGTAIGPLALIAKEAGYTVSGSDKRNSSYINYLRNQGIESIHIGQDQDKIARIHRAKPIDWYVYSSAVTFENPDAPELLFCKANHIHMSKRDELLNQIIKDQRLLLIAIAGTHGKTTTTTMVIWLMKQLNLRSSWSVGAKINFGDMGHFEAKSKYFIYEADEFDRNFLSFRPYMSLITGITYDHHEIFPTLENYQQAFKQFLEQSRYKIVWKSDVERATLEVDNSYVVLDDDDKHARNIRLTGPVNRRNAWQAIQAVHQLTEKPIDILIPMMNNFPGLARRFEKISNNLFSDYSHTIEKIQGCIDTALESSKNVVVVYEPLTDRRQHYIKERYKSLFKDVKRLYWVPTYSAREDPKLPKMQPKELIGYMQDPSVATPAELDHKLWTNIQKHVSDGDLVVCISAGGGNSLDEWVRQKARQN